MGRGDARGGLDFLVGFFYSGVVLNLPFHFEFKEVVDKFVDQLQLFQFWLIRAVIRCCWWAIQRRPLPLPPASAWFLSPSAPRCGSAFQGFFYIWWCCFHDCVLLLQCLPRSFPKPNLVLCTLRLFFGFFRSPWPRSACTSSGCSGDDSSFCGKPECLREFATSYYAASYFSIVHLSFSRKLRWRSTPSRWSSRSY